MVVILWPGDMTDCKITTGTETGCCKPGNDACEDWDVKSSLCGGVG